MGETGKKVLVLGATGLVGSALIRRLKKAGYQKILAPKRDELDLLDQVKVSSFFERSKPDFVINAAAKVGGILANNTYRADFIYENLSLQNNIFHACYKFGVEKMLFITSFPV